MTKFKWAAIEWGFSMTVLAAVYLQWKQTPGGRRAFWLRAIFLFLSSVNLLYHFPILFMVIGAIPEQHVVELTKAGQELSREGFNTLAHSAESLSRWIHASLGLLAGTCVYVAVLAIRVANEQQNGVQRDSYFN